MTRKKPTLIEVVAILNILIGVILLPLGVILATFPVYFQNFAIDFLIIINIISYVFIVNGILMLIAGIGLWQMKLWGFFVAIITYILNIVQMVVAITSGFLVAMYFVPSIVFLFIVLIHKDEFR